MNMAASEGGSLTVESRSRSSCAPRGRRRLLRRDSSVVAQEHGAGEGSVQEARRGRRRRARRVSAAADLRLQAAAVSAVVDYHRAIADASGVPIIAFQTPFVDYPAGTIAGLATIPSVVALKDAAFNRRPHRRAAGGGREDADQGLDRQRHLHPGSHAHGQQRRADRLRRHGDGRAGAHACAGGGRQDHGSLRDLERARPPRPHLLATAAARLPGPDEIHAHASGRDPLRCGAPAPTRDVGAGQGGSRPLLRPLRPGRSEIQAFGPGVGSLDAGGE